MAIREFMDLHYRHFNARETVAAAKGWIELLERGGKMMVTLAGAMSTAELGISLARMIREGKVHAISCTAANLEEDVFNLVAHDEYCTVPNWRYLTPEAELKLREDGFNRVTDTGIPETVLRHIEKRLVKLWSAAADAGESYFPCEYLYKLFEDESFHSHFQVPKEHSWLYTAWEHKIPVYSPGFEDSTLGNIFTSHVITGDVKSHSAVRSGTEQMEHLVNWYLENHEKGVGFFQIGGGIAGDFAICAVPLIIQDLQREVNLWAYFAQISDSTTSYGSYSGAEPTEKITWYKLAPDTPTYMINSDATIVAPLIFSYVLGD